VDSPAARMMPDILGVTWGGFILRLNVVAVHKE
jgi:hypothetical protein